MCKKIIFAGGNHAGYLQDGVPFVWGDNSLGQLGLRINSNFVEEPTKVVIPYPKLSSINRIVEMSMSDHHILFRDNLGRVYGSGLNREGQLGSGGEKITIENETFTVKNKPEIINLPEGESVKSILALNGVSFLVANSGMVYLYGDCEFVATKSLNCRNCPGLKGLDTPLQDSKRIQSLSTRLQGPEASPICIKHIFGADYENTSRVFFIDSEHFLYSCGEVRNDDMLLCRSNARAKVLTKVDILKKIQYGSCGKHHNIFVGLREKTAWLQGTNTDNALDLFGNKERGILLPPSYYATLQFHNGGPLPPMPRRVADTTKLSTTAEAYFSRSPVSVPPKYPSGNSTQYIKTPMEYPAHVRGVACGERFSAILFGSGKVHVTGCFPLPSSKQPFEDGSICVEHVHKTILSPGKKRIIEIAASASFLLLLDEQGGVYLYCDSDLTPIKKANIHVRTFKGFEDVVIKTQW